MKREPVVKQEKRRKVVFDPDDVIDLTCRVLRLFSSASTYLLLRMNNMGLLRLLFTMHYY